MRPSDSAPRGYVAQQVPASIHLKLDANEGVPQDAAWLERTLSNTSSHLLQRYPSGNDLEQQLADRHGVSPDHIFVTAGGDEAIERMCRLTLSPKRPLVVPTPTFEMIERYANLQRASVNGVAWPDHDRFPIEQVQSVITGSTGLLALVTPNNPTGRVIPREQAERLIRTTTCPVMLDLAYGEFADDDLSDLAFVRQGVIAIRTFSKAWGLAGLRVGYAVGDPQLLARMRASGGPYSVSSLSTNLVARAMRDKGSEMRRAVEAVRNVRGKLTEQLKNLGFTVVQSHANFVLVRHGRAAAIWAALQDHGVLVRKWDDRPELADALRITCPINAADFDTLCAALAAVTASETAS